jgi:predicted metal-binding membrane protein
MQLSKKTTIQIGVIIFGISILTWVLLLVNPGNIMTIEHCHVSASGPSATSLKMMLEMNPFSSQLFGWGLMVIAMMLPKLILPVQHIYQQSLRRYRFTCATVFILGYITVWMLAGVFMTALILGFNLLFPMSYIPGLIVFTIAVIWQFSPIKQRFLNLSHDHSPLSAFGIAAIKDSFMFGVSHGRWCVGSGWALMLFPMLLPQGHNLAMIIVTFLMISEHFEHPRFPRWEIKYRNRLLRIIIAQTKIKMIPIYKKNVFN